MKIMTFNIAEGGTDSNGSRIEHIINVTNYVSPDFLAIQEANDFEKNDYELLKRIGSEINLPYFEFSRGELYEYGGRNHVVSFSKTPMRNVHTFSHSPFTHAGLATTIDSSVGEITLCNVHLHSRSEDKRLEGTKTVLDYLLKFEKNIILGDCNAISQRDNYKDLSAKEFTIYNLNRFEVTDLLNNNHVDVAFLLNKSGMRTHPTTGVGHPISKTPVRIDYIFVSKPLVSNLKDIDVIKTETSEIASDHYPVVLTLG